jgi:DNA-binding FrmR family transcriptional regulator
MTPTTSTIEKVRNYQGQNSFVIKMKDTVSRYGSLTSKQLAAVEKCLNAVAVVKTEDMTKDMKRIVEYTGENTFVKDIASKFQKYGTLTEKQKSAALVQIQKEDDKERTFRMNWPTEGETIVVARKIGQQLKKTYGLEFNPTLLDITRLLAVSPKAVRFSGKMTVNRAKVCLCCGRTLTDEFSMLTNVGKTCAKHMKIDYITDRTQSNEFRERYLKRVEEIGEMEFWVPKNQIVKWEGVTGSVVKTM